MRLETRVHALDELGASRTRAESLASVGARVASRGASLGRRGAIVTKGRDGEREGLAM